MTRVTVEERQLPDHTHRNQAPATSVFRGVKLQRRSKRETLPPYQATHRRFSELAQKKLGRFVFQLGVSEAGEMLRASAGNIDRPRVAKSTIVSPEKFWQQLQGCHLSLRRAKYNRCLCAWGGTCSSFGC